MRVQHISSERIISACHIAEEYAQVAGVVVGVVGVVGVSTCVRNGVQGAAVVALPSYVGVFLVSIPGRVWGADVESLVAPREMAGTRKIRYFLCSFLSWVGCVYCEWKVKMVRFGVLELQYL